MSLPILKTSTAATPETLLRHFHRFQAKWSEHFSARTPLDFGTAWSSSEFNRVYIANRMLEVALPPQISPQQAFDQANEHFASQGSTCWKWTMNVSSPPEQTEPMEKFLLEKNYRRETSDLMSLTRVSLPAASAGAENLRIIPARSSFRHARAIYDEQTAHWNTPQLAEAKMLHLDDPHYDALIALKDGLAIAHVGVFSMGEVGFIEDFYVSPTFRRHGIGTIMMCRAMEICARSLFKHVLLRVLLDNDIAIALYKKFGFAKIGEFIEFQNPAT
jgi:ribosomal protein S18 acetylase RimI-like enzyme